MKLSIDDERYTKTASLISFSMIIAARKKVLSAKKRSLLVGNMDDIYSDTDDKRVIMPPKAIF